MPYENIDEEVIEKPAKIQKESEDKISTSSRDEAKDSSRKQSLISEEEAEDDSKIKMEDIKPELQIKNGNKVLSYNETEKDLTSSVRARKKERSLRQKSLDENAKRINNKLKRKKKKDFKFVNELLNKSPYNQKLPRTEKALIFLRLKKASDSKYVSSLNKSSEA